MSSKTPKGKLLIIGGAERKENGTPLLEWVAGEVKRTRRPLLVITAAS
jgi:cyanophycinase-like exopeptidase